MGRRIKGLYKATRIDQIRAMSSPLRLEVLEAACSMGECSVGEIADRLGRTRTSTYALVAQLVEVGLLSPTGSRRTGKRDETLYSAPARMVGSVFDSSDPKNVDAHVRYGTALMRMAGRKLTEAFVSPDARVRGAGRDTHAGSHKVWLNRAELAELNKKVDEIWAMCRSTEPGPGKKLINVTLTLTPDRDRNDDSTPDRATGTRRPRR